MTDERIFTLHQVGQRPGRPRDHRGQASGDLRPARAGADAGRAGADGADRDDRRSEPGAQRDGVVLAARGVMPPMFVPTIIRLLIWLLLSLCFRVLLIVLTVTEMWRWHRRERRWSGPVAVDMRR